MVGAAPAPFVVGIGASAGGLEALESLFENLGEDIGAAFVVVQHLSPDFKSLMVELLARRTRLPVKMVEDGERVEPDSVYLIPPGKVMIISGGRLRLSERDASRELTLPIDIFFRSLAQDCGPRAVAIVLSGGGTDGSRGIRAVHEAGGVVIVQDSESAQFDGMPHTARNAGVARWVLPPGDMPRVIAEHVRSGPDAPAVLQAELPRGLGRVYTMLEQAFGLDFQDYKPTTVTRRIERRLRLVRAEDLEDYVRRLATGDELDVLYRDLLIGVTRFFRNPEAFEKLERDLLPELFRRAPTDAPIRVWVAGCATGEEAYSLAIILHELSQKHGGRPVKIFATDVHRGSLEIAARATYDEEAVAHVPSERLERYFLRRGRSYQVVPELRQMLVFAPHNVINDAPFTRVDLITCRNMLIYLQPPAQQKVLGLFHFALNRGGLLFLGPSETPGAIARDFETVERHWRVYRKYSEARLAPERVPPRLVEPRLPASPAPTVTRHSLAHLLGTYDSLLDDYMPPSLLVSDRGELVHAFAGASRFLKLRDGRQGLELLDVVDDDLRVVLVGGLQRALKEPGAVVFRGVRIAGEVHDVTVRRVRGRSTGIPHLLVSFQVVHGAAPAPTVVATEIKLDDVSRDQAGMLQIELQQTKESLQAAIEELETSNEELQASNEELLASNEELQSTNEELQSVNEELYTVNAEYQRKIAELTELTNDMDNLLSSTDIGTIFLDGDLRIRKFTPQIGDSFNLLPQDIGRPIETFAHNIDHRGLVDDLRQVLGSGNAIEREVRDRNGRAFFLRILPYRAKATVDGVVLTLIDVSTLKAAEDALFHERHLLHSLLSSIPDAIYFKDARGRIVRANGPMADRLGLSDPRDAVGKTAFDLLEHEAALAQHRRDEAVVRSGNPDYDEMEGRGETDGVAQWDVVTRLPMLDGRGGIVGMIGIFRNVTAQKRAEEKAKEAVRRRDQFLAMLSHELRNPLGAISTAAVMLGSDYESKVKRERLVAIVERQSQQMARLLDDLLEASRVTQNKIELRRDVVDVRAVMRDAADAVRSVMEARKLRFALETPEAALLVHADPARLQQIQVNLLSNAAKYTDPGGQVTLRAERENGYAVIRVIDDGAGIPKGLQESIFELFVQSNRTLDRSHGGIGVGLTLVRSLVEMHGGTVEVHSEGDGKGSEFVVRLPISLDVPRRDAPALRAAPKLDAGATVVVIEDNTDSREMLCELFETAGFSCHGAENGRAGVALVDEVRPALAIVDVGLPELDGYEVARRIRANPAHASIHLVALTGYGQTQDRKASVEAGFDEHLVKPLHPDHLMRLLAGPRHAGVRPQAQFYDATAPARRAAADVTTTDADGPPAAREALDPEA